MQSQISSKPICQNLWENKFANDNFDWSKIWKTSVNNVKEPRLKTLNWKIISNIYPTKVFLEKIKKESTNICEMCDEIDFLEHFFFSCKKIKMIWYEIEKLLSQKYDIDIKLTQKEVLFGYHDDMYDVKLVNTFISIGKLSISKYRYGKYPHLIIVLHLELQIRNLL